MSTASLFTHLSDQLSKSMSKERKQWAKEIVDNDFPLTEFFELFEADERTRNRFQMLVSDIAIYDKDYMQRYMPELLSRSKQKSKSNIRRYMAKWWYYVGVPEEQEGEALDILFEVLLNPEEQIHVKTPAFHATRILVRKYPELEAEFIQVLEDQLGKISAAFDHRSIKYIEKARKRLSQGAA